MGMGLSTTQQNLILHNGGLCRILASDEADELGYTQPHSLPSSGIPLHLISTKINDLQLRITKKQLHRYTTSLSYLQNLQS